ncbi:MAG: hypothetical protein ABI197_09640 [Granulicella sp.]
MLGTTMHTAFSDYAGIALFLFTAAVLLGFRWRSARLKRQAQLPPPKPPPLTDPFSMGQSPPPDPPPSPSAKAPPAVRTEHRLERVREHKLNRVRLSPEAREDLRREEEKEELEFGAKVAAAPAPSQRVTSVAYAEASGSVTAMPLDVPTVMRVLVTIAILAAALFIVLAQHHDAEQQKWAYGAIGTILGYWLRG